LPPLPGVEEAVETLEPTPDRPSTEEAPRSFGLGGDGPMPDPAPSVVEPRDGEELP
jgi:hypothetical protein